MIYLIYTTDNWHTNSSRALIGIATSNYSMFEIIQTKVKKDNSELSEDDIYNLDHIRQTQGYEGPGEFDTELYENNEIDILI